jgi:hypothetical protein
VTSEPTNQDDRVVPDRDRGSGLAKTSLGFTQDPRVSALINEPILIGLQLALFCGQSKAVIHQVSGGKVKFTTSVETRIPGE